MKIANQRVLNFWAKSNGRKADFVVKMKSLCAVVCDDLSITFYWNGGATMTAQFDRDKSSEMNDVYNAAFDYLTKRAAQL